MIRQDYIMRMIEQLVRVLAKVFLNKKQGNYTEAVNDIESSFKGIIGLDYNFLAGLTDEDTISLLTINKESAAAKCIIAAKLFKERTEVKALLANADKQEVEEGYQKSLKLFIEGMINDEEPDSNEFVGYYSEIDPLIKKINLNEIPPDLRFRLFKYYDLTGNYAKAEDELFRLKELDYKNIREEGIRFYDRLEKLSDSELKEGNLSKEEVFEGMAAFLQKRS